MPYAGLTALYLSGNAFTSDALLRLLKASDRFQVLDLDAPFKETRYSASLPAPPATDGTAQETAAPHPVVSATHLLSLALSPRLCTLRVHHALVTQGAGYMPDTNPHLTSLTLTCIPPLSPPSLVTSLRAFLLAAATQERGIALARAGSGEGGGRRGVKVREGLRHLRLEIGGKGVESVSGDRDADAFAEAGAGDFSFFDNPGDEGGGGGEAVKKDEKVDVRAELRRWRGAEGGGERRWRGRLEVVVKGGEE
ncbi:hypothetical protein V497_01326 [Pseudogymnoascus sp. VKM F-4516 (FW-969)]|nr:hypothetical protein V497_01326 [Pseudogymnoascus sp. VKM F-4516 (FW-969)]